MHVSSISITFKSSLTFLTSFWSHIEFGTARSETSTSLNMCGIFGIFSSSLEEGALRKELIQCSETLRHRGPDWSGYVVIPADEDKPLAHGIAHERLAIMDPESGSQPLVSEDENVIVAANGEIYNYKEVYKALKDAGHEYSPKTGSDCEVMLPLYEKYGATEEMVNTLRGMFSFILYDKAKDMYVVARDHIGITPLYIGWANDGSTYIASEMKALVNSCNTVQQFPPGHIFCSKGENAGKFVRWYTPEWAINPTGPLPTDKYNAVSTHRWNCL